MFELIFSALDFLYNDGLKYHLMGYTKIPETGGFDYIGTDLYNMFGIVAFVSAVLIAVVFYYVWDPAKSMRPRWFLSLAVTTVFNFIFSSAMLYSDIANEKVRLPEGYNFGTQECYLFGFSDFIVAAIFFIAISFIIRLRSRNNNITPIQFKRK